MVASFVIDGSTLSGNAVVSGNGPDTPVSLTGSIDCASVLVTTSYGMTPTGNASDAGGAIAGTYVTSPTPHHGTLEIHAV